ncbi:MAG: hypothetical protein AAFO69_07105 [Bacteroidota bacterium]
MSKLDDYISKLLTNDDALKEFLVDPIKAAEDENGLTKAQRSVLRRTVHGLSNNATNGYGIVRHLDSYKRSLRLLQNVLHVERGTAGAHAAATVSDIGKEGAPYHTLFLYYNGDPGDPTSGNPYAYYIPFYGYGNTIGEVMSNAYNYTDGQVFYLENLVTLDSTNQYVIAFEIPDAFPGSGTYKAVPEANTRNPFWFYSVNGRAITLQGGGYYVNPYASYGTQSESFTTFPLDSSDTIYWQLIAPDTRYRFQPCTFSTVENTF